MGQVKAPEIPRPVNAFGLNEEETVGGIEEYADLTAATMVQQMTRLLARMMTTTGQKAQLKRKNK